MALDNFFLYNYLSMKKTSVVNVILLLVIDHMRC